MIRRIEIGEYLSQVPLLPVIDVRSPAEYASGHLPGAVNIPLFSDSERAEVGTAYTRVSADKAYQLGYRFVEPKLESFVQQSKEVARDGSVTVYCWRGGLRSRTFAEHIEANGISNVFVIEGGYKSFRHHALNAFSFPGLRILGGYTGSGKTRILRKLGEMGKQVIDLEGIACHKGSAFGAIGQPKQPANEHFTNLLYWEWKSLDTSQHVWLEDESIYIGSVFIPEVLFQRMRDSVVYFLDIPKEQRAALLVEEYAGIDALKLVESVKKISKRLGGLRTREALEALERGDYFTTAVITLDYYDKYYRKGLERRDRDKVVVIPSETTDAEVNAGKLMEVF